MALKDIDTLRTEIDYAVHTNGPRGKITAAGVNALLQSLATELTTLPQEMALAATSKLDKAANLADVLDVAAARANLGIAHTAYTDAQAIAAVWPYLAPQLQTEVAVPAPDGAAWTGELVCLGAYVFSSGFPAAYTASFQAAPPALPTGRILSVRATAGNSPVTLTFSNGTLDGANSVVLQPGELRTIFSPPGATTNAFTTQLHAGPAQAGAGAIAIEQDLSSLSAGAVPSVAAAAAGDQVIGLAPLQDGDYTLQITDLGKVVLFRQVASCFVAPHVTVPLPVGAVVEVMALGPVAITITALGNPVKIVGRPRTSGEDGHSVRLLQRSLDEWVVTGGVV